MKNKRAYLGIDAGSVSIKLALIDENKNLVSSTYLRNMGLIETIKKGLKEIVSNINNNDYDIRKVGVAGSGRKFIGKLVGADTIETEVFAHYVAAVHNYPNVRTIMDIGGEDSKIISVKNGILEDFELNAVCGAGTGSVIDAVAARIGIKIEEVGDLALQSKQELDFPGKCGIFAQSSVVSRLNTGADKSDILMGMIRALVSNYLTLAKKIELKEPYVYQGATAKNKAIVKALEEQLGHEIIVPEHCDVMGAIGAALLAKEENIETTKFKGYDNLLNKNYETRTIIAKGCENHCELTQIYEENKLIGIIGNRCEKCVSNLENILVEKLK